MVAMERRELERSEDLHREALAIRRELDDAHCSATSHIELGRLELLRGEPAGAAGHFREGVTLLRQCGVRHTLVGALEGLAEVEAAAGDGARAGRLLGAAEVIRESNGTLRIAEQDPARRRTIAALEARLGQGPMRSAWIEGRAAPLEKLLDEAIADGASA
jgi:hypothetical protein